MALPPGSTTPWERRLGLPEPVLYRPWNACTQYGVNAVVAGYCGQRSFSEGPINGVWQHGWAPRFLQYSPKAVMQTAPLKPQDWNWVARKDEVAYLASQGFPKARAIGLPFVYAPDVEADRMPGSVLFMPGHSLPKIKRRFDQDRALDQIEEVKAHSDVLVACLHPACVEENVWRPLLEKAHVPFVRGAGSNNQKALVRLKRLFGSFETVWSNAYGSHVSMAASCGAKVAIWGDYCGIERDEAAKNVFYRNNPELLDKMVAAVSEETVKGAFPFLFTVPHKAIDSTEWGREQIGATNRLNPKELERCLVLPPLRKRLTILASQPGIHYRRLKARARKALGI